MTNTDKKYQLEKSMRSSDSSGNYNNLRIGKEKKHTAASFCKRCKRNLSDLIFS